MEGFIKIFGIALFLMIVIAFSATIFYPNDVTAEEQYDDYVNSNYLNMGALLSFKDWVNTQFDMSRNIIINGYTKEMAENEYNNNVPLNNDLHTRILWEYSWGDANTEKYELFNYYNSGFNWWDSSPSISRHELFGIGTTYKERIKYDFYNEYLQEYGYILDEDEGLVEYKKNLLDYAFGFLSSLGGSFVAITDILTFNFHPSDAPSDSMFNNVVAIFIYPLVAIVTIGLGLFAAKFITAIGNLIPTT